MEVYYNLYNNDREIMVNMTNHILKIKNTCKCTCTSYIYMYMYMNKCTYTYIFICIGLYVYVNIHTNEFMYMCKINKMENN